MYDNRVTVLLLLLLLLLLQKPWQLFQKCNSKLMVSWKISCSKKGGSWQNTLKKVI